MIFLPCDILLSNKAVEEEYSKVKFEWDEYKNIVNKEKHKISFETAVFVFDDPHYIEMFDFEHSIDEDRYIAIGKV